VPALRKPLSPRDFVQHHRPSLERDEVRHNLILSIFDRLALDPHPNLRLWSRGAPGACAARSPGYPIVLGELTQAQCRALAEETHELDYPGVVGAQQTARWFAERAIEFGLTFLKPIPQLIHVLRERPNYPSASGHPRVISPAELEMTRSAMDRFYEDANSLFVRYRRAANIKRVVDRWRPCLLRAPCPRSGRRHP
jgi:hypothetical protein